MITNVAYVELEVIDLDRRIAGKHGRLTGVLLEFM